jgi:hypothetical protein
LADPPASLLRTLWRPRELALALALGLVVTLVVIWRDADRADATYVIGAVPEQPVAPIEITKMPRRSFALPRLTDDGRGRVLLQIATYLQRPTATVRLDILDSNGRSQARCTFPPSSYHDNTLLPCDVPSVVRARRVIVSHTGPAKLAVFANHGVAGYVAYTRSGGLISRIHSVLDRVGISLPAGWGPVMLVGGLWLSVAATALAVLLALGVTREGTDTLLQHGEALSEPAGVLAEPREHEREMQQDSQEEAERHDEQGVGGRGDAERVRDAGEQGRPGGKDEQRQPGRQPEH